MYTIVYNPISLNKTCIQKVTSLLKEREIEFVVHETKINGTDDDLSDIAKSERIVVIGGDGTVNLAINAAKNTNIPIAIVPAGTGNDIARSIGLKDANDIGYIIDGSIVDVDVWSINESRLFAGFVACGLLVLMNDINKHSEHGYKKSLVKEMMRYAPRKCTVTYDGGRFDGHVLTLSAQNIGTIGGGAVIGDAPNSDGFLDLMILKKKSKMRILLNILSLRKKGIASQPNVTMIRTSSVTITTEDGTFLSDGEEFNESTIVVKHAGKAKFVTKG